MRHTEKVAPDFSVCLVEIFSCGVDFSKNGGDFLKRGAALLLHAQMGDLPVASVAFSVALQGDRFASVNSTTPAY